MEISPLSWSSSNTAGEKSALRLSLISNDHSEYLEPDCSNKLYEGSLDCLPYRKFHMFRPRDFLKYRIADFLIFFFRFINCEIFGRVVIFWFLATLLIKNLWSCLHWQLKDFNINKMWKNIFNNKKWSTVFRGVLTAVYGLLLLTKCDGYLEATASIVYRQLPCTFGSEPLLGWS